MSAACLRFVLVPSLVVMSTVCSFAQDVGTLQLEKVKSKDAETKEVKPTEVKLAKGALTVMVPGNWKTKQPRFSMIEKEYEIPAGEGEGEGEDSAARLTIMRSGGSVQVNVDRWVGQFTQPDGKKTSEVAKITDKEVHDQPLKIVDISGTFKETVGPPRAGGKTVMRPDYRMFGAILQTKHGQYFFKVIGSAKTLADAEKPFIEMVESVIPAK